MYSAHWDHLGMALPVNGDAIYNGAIDNATGMRRCPRDRASLRSIAADAPTVGPVCVLDRGGERSSRSGILLASPFVPACEDGRQHQLRRPVSVRPDTRRRGQRPRNGQPPGRWCRRRRSGMNLEIAPDPRPEQGSYYRSDHFMLARIGIPAFRDRTRHARSTASRTTSPTRVRRVQHEAVPPAERRVP